MQKQMIWLATFGGVSSLLDTVSLGEIVPVQYGASPEGPLFCGDYLLGTWANKETRANQIEKRNPNQNYIKSPSQHVFRYPGYHGSGFSQKSNQKGLASKIKETRDSATDEGNLPLIVSR
mmetsp:Transcript_12541/g.29083  ORF Transcript_12541/g.29083 Transcript_12541/m.29083 type:complete len:120 (-) Transcript_12541:8-367(-)